MHLARRHSLRAKTGLSTTGLGGSSARPLALLGRYLGCAPSLQGLLIVWAFDTGYVVLCTTEMTFEIQMVALQICPMGLASQLIATVK